MTGHLCFIPQENSGYFTIGLPYWSSWFPFSHDRWWGYSFYLYIWTLNVTLWTLGGTRVFGGDLSALDPKDTRRLDYADVLLDYALVCVIGGHDWSVIGRVRRARRKLGDAKEILPRRKSVWPSRIEWGRTQSPHVVCSWSLYWWTGSNPPGQPSTAVGTIGSGKCIVNARRNVGYQVPTRYDPKLWIFDWLFTLRIIQEIGANWRNFP